MVIACVIYMELTQTPVSSTGCAYTFSELGVYTILPSSILYGVWHRHGGSVAGRILRNGRAIVL